MFFVDAAHFVLGAFLSVVWCLARVWIKAPSGRWAWRDRPVYTFYLDKEPGDINGDSWGEFQGQRNGFKAIWFRDDYFNNAS